MASGEARGNGGALVTVVLCTTGERSTLRGCLASLGAIEDPALEVLVIENRPTSRLPAGELAAWGARLVHEPRQGLDVARNRGVAEAAGELVAFVDDDCVVDPGWVAALRRAFDDPTVQFATGRVRPHSLGRRSERAFEGWFRFDRGPAARRYRREPDWTSVIPPRLGTGCNMAFRRSVLLAVGGFDEGLDMGSWVGGGGDLDVFGRLLRAGHEAVYVPDALVWHRHRETSAAVARQFWGYGVSQGAVAAKVWWAEPEERRHVRAFLLHRTRRIGAQVLRRAGRRAEPGAGLLSLELLGVLAGPAIGAASRRRARVAGRRVPTGAPPGAGGGPTQPARCGGRRRRVLLRTTA